MNRLARQAAALSAVLVIAALAGGCTTAQPQPSIGPSVPPASSVPPALSAPPAGTTAGTSAGGPATTAPAPALPQGSHGGRSPASGSPAPAGSPAAAGGRPADWPPQVPVPRGAVIGFTGSADRWSVSLVSSGPADEVRRATVALYEAAGFTPATDSVLNMGHLQVTIVAENRDHSATETNLVVGVTTT